MNHIAEDYTKYVDVFYGNGEIDLPKPEGIAKTWQLLKGLCGNTSPAAALPFGKFTCGPYSGGYPTGYFFEVHPDPDNALSDGPNMLCLDNLENVIKTLL